MNRYVANVNTKRLLFNRLKKKGGNLLDSKILSNTDMPIAAYPQYCYGKINTKIVVKSMWRIFK